MPDDHLDKGGSWQVGGAEGGWWAVERGKFLADRLSPAIRRSNLAIDLGCGRGETVDFLVDQGAGFVVGVDAEPWPAWTLRSGQAAFVVADLARPPFRQAVADLVSAFDVIEHFADDSTPLSAARLVAGAGAMVAVTVPSGPKLWSPFDERVGHHRRYTRPTLEAALQRNGLEPVDTTHFFSWLVIPARLLRRRDRTDAVAGGPGLGLAVAGVVSFLCALERAVLRRRSLPFGTSLWVSCRVAPEDRSLLPLPPRPSTSAAQCVRSNAFDRCSPGGE